MSAFPDPESFRLFVEENFEALASFARSVLGSDLDAEDMAQEALINVYRRRGRIDPRRSPRSYTYRVTYRLCLSRLRRTARRNNLARLFFPLVSAEAAPPSAPLDAWFKSLPERQRAIAHLFFAEDRTAEEIASFLKISASTVRVQLTRIRARLQAASRAPALPKRCTDAS